MTQDIRTVKDGKYLVVKSAKDNFGLMTGHVLEVAAGVVYPVIGKGNSREYIKATPQSDFNGVAVVAYKDEE